MKKSILILITYILCCTLQLEAQDRSPHNSHNSQVIPEEIRGLAGFWRQVNPSGNVLVLYPYYKVVQADTFFSFEIDPGKGNIPTSYGRYSVEKDGRIIEHTLGDHRAQRNFDAEISYTQEDENWLSFKYRLDGHSGWTWEFYLRVSREDPQEQYRQFRSVRDSIHEKESMMWADSRRIMNEKQPFVEKKQYTEAADLLKQALTKYEGLPVYLQKTATEIRSHLLYDMACYSSLQGKKTEAIGELSQAIEAGWDNYSHAMADKDLDKIRKKKEFKVLLEKMRPTGDFPYILRQCGEYARNTAGNLPAFTYMKPEDENLTRVRKYFNLDSIAGQGDEISRIKNLLLWVHNAVRHDGSSFNPDSQNAIDLVNICRKENRGINCRMMAMVLNECYLAMGFESRFITCMPKVMKSDCHVINCVYSKTLKKWLWMDPTFNAYFSDDRGNLLSIAEVRERIRKQHPLVLNEDANWNNTKKETLKEYYAYMSKNLYHMGCHTMSAFGIESKEYPEDRYVTLIPQNYTPDSGAGIITTDDQYFWQSPE